MTVYELNNVSVEDARAVFEELADVDAEDSTLVDGKCVSTPDGMAAVFEMIENVVVRLLEEKRQVGEEVTDATVTHTMLMLAVRFGAQLGERRRRPLLEV